MKRLVAFVLVLSLLIGVNFFSERAYAAGSYDFANFTEADSVAFVEACNIDVPDGFAEVEQFPAFTRALILQSYHYPNVEFCFNFHDTQRYAEDIRAAVRLHMDLAAQPATASVLYGTLQYCNGQYL